MILYCDYCADHTDHYPRDKKGVWYCEECLTEREQ